MRLRGPVVLAGLILLFASVSVLGHLAPNEVVAMNAIALATNLDAYYGWTSDLDPCCGNDYNDLGNWVGVVCNNNCSVEQNVIHINVHVTIPPFVVQSTLPPQIADLKYLMILEMSGFLSGSIPEEIGQLEYLSTLTLTNNMLTSIPYTIVNCTNLRLLSLNTNMLSGSADVFGNMSWLISFDIGNNMFSGSIPDLSAAENLVVVSMTGNQLTGTIPAWIGNLTFLANLDLSNNFLTGTIPPLALPQLAELNLGQNKLSGTIPPLGAMTALSELMLNLNLFEGEIPQDFWALSGLSMVDFSGNSRMNTTLSADMNISMTQLKQFVAVDSGLRGEFPAQMFTSFIEYIMVSENDISGPLPECPDASNSENFFELVVFDVSANWFSGSIPTCFSNFTYLTVLRLSGNELTGTIPEVIMKMPHLNVLDLSGNQLTGTIPPLNLDNAGLQYVALGDNKLVGLPPVIGIVQEYSAYMSTLLYLDISDLNTQGQTLDTVIMAMTGLTTCQGPWSGGLPMLSTLFMPRTNVTGQISPYFMCVFPGLTSLTLSDNLLTGSIPETPLPYFLESIDLSNNFLQGPIPVNFGAAIRTSLYSLNLVDNGLSGDDGKLPYFLTHTWRVQIDNTTGSYSCPGIINEDGTSQVLMDPAFYHYDLCNCSYNHYGSVRAGCLPSYTLCQPSAPNCVNTSISANSAVAIAIGYAPSPNNSFVTAFLPCTQIGQESVSAGCTETCLCSVDANNGVSCENCSVCAEGYESRLCGQCSDNYYHLSSLCLPCQGSVQAKGWVAIFVSAFFIVSSIVLALFLDEPLPTKQPPPVPQIPRTRTNTNASGTSTLPRTTTPTTPVSAHHLAPNSAVQRTFTRSTIYNDSESVYESQSFAELPSTDDKECCGGVRYGLSAVIILTVVDLVIITLLILLNQVALWEIELLALVGILSILFMVVWQQMGYRRAKAEAINPEFSREASNLSTAWLLGGSTQPEQEDFMDKGLLKSFLFYLQVSFALIPLSVLTVAPPAVSTAVGTLNGGAPVAVTTITIYKQVFSGLEMVLQLHPSGLDCILDLPNEYKVTIKTTIVMLLPLIYVIGTGVVYALRQLFIKRDELLLRRKAILMGRAISTMLFLFYFLFFSLLARALMITDCVLDPTPGVTDTYYVLGSPYIQCYSSLVWQYTALVSFLPMFIYLVLTIGVMRHLYSLRHSLSDPVVKAAYGFLYSSYRSTVWWFEVVTLLRRTLIAVFLTVISVNSSFRAQLIVSVLTTALVVQIQVRPYKTSLANSMETASLVVIMLSYLATQLIQEADTDTYGFLGVNALRIIVITGNVVFFFVFLGALASKMLQRAFRALFRKPPGYKLHSVADENRERESLAPPSPQLVEGAGVYQTGQTNTYGSTRTLDRDIQIQQLQDQLEEARLRESKLNMTVRDRETIITGLRQRIAEGSAAAAATSTL